MMARRLGAQKYPLSLSQLNEIDNLLETIQGTDCAACGAPDCRTFAEDVVRGNASVEDCLFLKVRGECETLKSKGNKDGSNDCKRTD
jgi:Na+-translocating ferredoxin:NAD+ oxidoreductase RNF subunit RnfB